MQVNIIIFGQLAEITGTHNLTLSNVADTNELQKKLQLKFPGLMNEKYVMAVDKKIISENVLLNNNSTIALLPPFSGG